MDLTEEKTEPREQIATGRPYRFYYGWIIVLVSFVVMTFAAPLLASFSIFYVALYKDLGWSRGSTAIALAIFLLVTGFAGPIVGGLFDKFNPRWMMVIGTVTTAVALLWLGVMTNLWEFYIAYGVLASAGSSLIHIVPFASIISNWFVRFRGLALGIVTGGMGLGQVVIPVLQQSIDQFGWRGTYRLVALMFFVIPTTLIIFFLHRRPEDRGVSLEEEGLLRTRSKDSSVTVGQSITGDEPKNEVRIVDEEWARREWTTREAVRTSRFWTLLLLITLFGTGYMMINVQMVAYLGDKGYSSILAASAVGLQGFVYIFGRIFGGALSDRIGREKTVTVSAVIFILFLVTLYIAGFVSSPILVYASVVLYGMGGAMPLPALIAAAGDIFQGKHFGAIIGLLLLGGYIGGAVGAWLGGYLFDHLHSYDWHFILAIGVTVASSALIWKARPSKVRVIRAVSVGS
jgi:MFS family permease